MNEQPNPLLDRAISLITAEQPLPVDLTAALLEQGIDVEGLHELHGS